MKRFIKTLMLTGVLVTVLASCDRSSSPEGRMGIKLEDLQQQMLDSMQQHHRALMDSIGQLRQELNTLKGTQ